MEETKALLRQLHADNNQVRCDIKALQVSDGKKQRSQDRLKVVLSRWAAAIIVAVLVVGLFIWRFVAQSNCNIDRTRALTGPGNERVTLFLGAFTASVTVQHLTPAQRAAALKVLREARERYPLIPTDAELAKLPDAQIAGDSEAVRALDKNREYNEALKRHPVCTLWGI